VILADENLDHRIIRILREKKFKVLSVAEEFQGISDFDIIKIARSKNFIILTEDKDFGEWVFSHKSGNISVVFSRYHHTDFNRIATILLKVITDKEFDLKGRFTTITTNKIRSRRI